MFARATTPLLVSLIPPTAAVVVTPIGTWLLMVWRPDATRLTAAILNVPARASMALPLVMISIVSLTGAALRGVVGLQAILLAAVTTPIMFAGTPFGAYLFKPLPAAYLISICLVILVDLGLVAVAKALV